MKNKVRQAMCILSREEKRRRSLKVRRPKYISEVRFLRKLIRGLMKGLSVFTMKEGKYPVLLTESQVRGILQSAVFSAEPCLTIEEKNNFENQIKIIIEENESGKNKGSITKVEQFYQ